MMALVNTGFELALCAMIVTTALLAVTVRDRFGVVVFFIVYGVFVGLGWLRLGAVDVALAEVALGAGLTGLLLLGANARLPESLPVPSRLAGHVMAAGAGGIAALGAGWAFLSIRGAAGLRQEVAANLETTGVENPVTAVLLNFRGWDTLIESVVLLAALIGIWSTAQDRAWGGRPGLRQHVKSGGVLDSFGRLLPPIGLVVGIYIFWAGSSQPGGAFQAGTLLAAVAVVAMMGGAMQPPLIASRWLRLSLVAGPAIFLAIGLAGAAAGTFLGQSAEIAKTLTLFVEAALTLSIAATLALAIIGPPEEQPPEEPSREEQRRGERV